MKTDWSKHWENSSKNNFLWGFWKWRIKRMYENILRGYEVSGSVIELGCGSGSNSLILSKMFNLDSITLVDSNDKALEIAKNTFRGSRIKTNFLRKDVLKMNLRKKFDLVHSEGLVEHFYGKDLNRIFKKHADLCKKGGLIVIIAPYNNLQYRFYRKAYSLLGKWIWDETPFEKRTIFSICKKNKLKILRFTTSVMTHELGILLTK